MIPNNLNGLSAGLQQARERQQRMWNQQAAYQRQIMQGHNDILRARGALSAQQSAYVSTMEMQMASPLKRIRLVDLVDVRQTPAYQEAELLDELRNNKEAIIQSYGWKWYYIRFLKWILKLLS